METILNFLTLLAYASAAYSVLWIIAAICVIWANGANVRLLRSLDVEPYSHLLWKPALLLVVSILWTIAPYVAP